PRSGQWFAAIDPDGFDALGQGSKELFAVARGHEPRIEHNDPALVRTAADEPAKALLEPDNRARQGLLAERVTPLLLDAFEPRLGQRSAGRVEGQPRDDHAAQRIAPHIDSLPEARCPEQDRPWVALETLEDLCA